MRFVVSATPEKAARAAARHIARRLRVAIEERGAATLALSGGSSVPVLLAELARQPLDWSKLHVFQVDERVAPTGSAARNLTAAEAALVGPGRLARERLHAMPVENEDASGYAAELVARSGSPPVLDVVQLGLGADGHTASLFPGDPALATDALVACTAEHAGHRRMTLTLPVINAARRIVWLAHGAEKAAALTRLATRGWQAPAGRVVRRHAVVYTDQAAL